MWLNFGAGSIEMIKDGAVTKISSELFMSGFLEGLLPVPLFHYEYIMNFEVPI